MARKNESSKQTNQNNNFASLYGGATIIERNIEAENTKSILDDNQDR